MDYFTQIKNGNKGQLICFPYLGGHAYSFSDFTGFMKGDFEIWAANPPGHLTSRHELVTDIDSLVDMYYKEIIQIISPHSCILGHSMGGIVAVHLINKLTTNDEALIPHKLVLSATSEQSFFQKKKYSDFHDKELIEHLKGYGGLPDELLADQELMNVMLPVFRADYKVLESAGKIPLPQLETEVMILWGEDDKIQVLENAKGWEHVFSKGINIIPLKNAAHMFIHSHADEVAKYVSDFMQNEK